MIRFENVNKCYGDYHALNDINAEVAHDEARMKIRAAVQAAKESGIMIMARTECRPTLGIDEAIAPTQRKAPSTS